MVIFRQHRGGLAESLETAKEFEEEFGESVEKFIDDLIAKNYE